jgi:hypothetical protein
LLSQGRFNQSRPLRRENRRAITLQRAQNGHVAVALVGAA